MLEPIEGSTVTLKREAYTWSFSRYKMWKECNERYVIEYLMRQRPAYRDERPFLQGSIAHGLIEEAFASYLEGIIQDGGFQDYCLNNLDMIIDKYSARIPDWKPGEIDRVRKEAVPIAISYSTMIEENGLLSRLNRDEPSWTKRIPDVRCEHTIGTGKNPLLLDNGLRLTGYIDWLKIDGGKGIVLDAKTSKSMFYLDSDQLVFYAIAAEKEFGVPVDKAAWMMIRTGKTHWYDITPEMKENLISGLLSASRQASEIDLVTFPNAAMCGPCPHSTGACTRYSNWIIDGGNHMDVEW